MKDKTLATYLALLCGTFGAHRFYLKSISDPWGWVHVLTTSLGLYGIWRTMAFGHDDSLAWLLLPFFGVSLAAACCSAIFFGLMEQVKWNKAYNRDMPSDSEAGHSTGRGIFAVILALLVGGTAFLATIAFTGQRYFEYTMKNV